MSNLNFTYRFNSGISVGISGDIFEQSFGNKIEIEKILNDISNDKTRKIIGINGSMHSNKITIINAKNINNQTRLLKEGIDGVIITNLNQYKDKISLILGVADCAAISFSSDDGNTIGLVHAGWSGVGKNIIGNIVKKLIQIGNELENYKFYIGPMAGKNFEFNENKYFEEFQILCDKYNLHSGKYFSPTDIGKGNLDLRGLILDILLVNGINHKNVKFSDIETNSSDNNWPSFRQNRTNKRIGVFLEN